MQVNRIDVDKCEATLSFNRHETLLIRKALQKMSSELTRDDEEFLLLEMNGVDDLLKDGNFVRFLGYHRALINEEMSPKESEQC
jgi:hypothetical protein